MMINNTTRPKLPHKLKFVLLYPVPVSIEIILNDDCLSESSNVKFDLVINHKVIEKIKKIMRLKRKKLYMKWPIYGFIQWFFLKMKVWS